MSLQSRIAELEAELKQLKREASRPRYWENIPEEGRDMRSERGYANVTSRCRAATSNGYMGKYRHCGMSRMKASLRGFCVAHERMISK